jgi:competence protein ComEA
MKKQGGMIILVIGSLCLMFLTGLFVGRCSSRETIKQTAPGSYTVAPSYMERRININTADAATLQSLPGIGEILAQRIIQYRNENGPFTSVYDLQNVEGIGAKKLMDILELIYVEDGT